MYVLKKWRNTNIGIELRTAFYTSVKKMLPKDFVNKKTAEQNKVANRFRDIAPQLRNLLGALRTLHFVLPKFNFKTS